MSEEKKRTDNVMKLVFKKRDAAPDAVELPQVYGRINAMNIVEYGLVGVTATDATRLLRALMQIGIRLIEIGDQ